MSNIKPKHELKSRIELMEKEILKLTGKDRAQARLEYHNLLRSYSKECGLEEPIYLIRA
jgi:hypothetical protein